MSSLIARTVDFKPGERNIFFHVLTACNLACKHCYINPDQHGTGMVAKETMAAWLALFATPGKASNLIFLGGEPTLHPDLAHGIRMARSLGYRSITVDTNGFLFHNFLHRVSPDELDFISFSLDGPSAAANDPIRGEGVFGRCTAGIKEAKKLGFRVSVIYTASRLNIDSLAETPALLADLGVDRFFIQVIGIRGKPARKGQGQLQLTPDEWLTKVPAAARAAAELGLEVVFPKVFLDADEVFQCGGNVAENYFIFPNGRVYLCPLCEDFPINSYRIENGLLQENQGLVERRFFSLAIPEGCIMSKLLQPGNIAYDPEGRPIWKISCCLLKQEIQRID